MLLTRIMLPFLTLVAYRCRVDGHAELAAPLLHPRAPPAMFNVATIVCADTGAGHGARRLAPDHGIAIGTLVGGLAQLSLQWPLLRRQGFRYEPVLNGERRDCAAYC